MKKREVIEKDVIIVGGGPAGLMALQQQATGEGSLALLEASENLGGRAQNALHLLDADQAARYPVLTGSMLGALKVRWEKQWKPAREISWSSKDWVAFLPQWELLFDNPQVLYMGFAPQASDKAALYFRSPVSRIEKMTDTAQPLWLLETPERDFIAKKVIWAAGLMPFQNAFGKQETQDFSVANPRYRIEAADFRGGVALDIEVPADAQWDSHVDLNSLLGIPFRFEGKLHLMICAVAESSDGWVLKTLTHASLDVLGETKTVMSFQKVLRRIAKSLFAEGYEISENRERWVVSDRVLGHSLGNPWLLGAGSEDGTLVFGVTKLWRPLRVALATR